MSEALAVDFICPRCGNAWSDDLNHLDRVDQEIDKGGSTANGSGYILTDRTPFCVVIVEV